MNESHDNDQMNVGGKCKPSDSAAVSGREALENRVLFCNNFPRDFDSRTFRSMVECAMFDEKLKFHENALAECRRCSSETGEIRLEFYNATMATRALNLNGYQFEFNQSRERRRIYFQRHPNCLYSRTSKTPTWQEYNATNKQHQLIKTKQENLGRVIEVHGVTASRCSKELNKFVTGMMMGRSLTLFPGYPITCIRSQKSPALITFRTHEEAAAAMQLSNVEFMGKRLQMMRPRKYLEWESTSSAHRRNHNEDRDVSQTSNLFRRETPQEVARRDATDCNASAPYDELLQGLQKTISELNESKAHCTKLQADLDGANQKLKFMEAEIKYSADAKEKLKRMRCELKESKDSYSQLKVDLDQASRQLAIKDEQLTAAGAKKETLEKDMSSLTNKWLESERENDTLQAESAIQARALRITEEHINSLRKNLKHLAQTEGLSKIICKHEELPHKKRRRLSGALDSVAALAHEDVAKIKKTNANNTAAKSTPLKLKVENDDVTAAAAMQDSTVAPRRSYMDAIPKKKPLNKQGKVPEAKTEFYMDI